MPLVFTNISEVYTPMQRITGAALAVKDSRVAWLGSGPNLPDLYRSWPQQDIGNRAVLPGLVDSHTHLVWAGSRVDEYRRRAKGSSYEEILSSGGGIYNTVTATQKASEDELYELARERAKIFLRGGVTTLELKSGYGLEAEHELKMLKVIRRLKETLPQRFVPTLLAHVIPHNWSRQSYLEMFSTELIPEVKRLGLAEAVDVFCDQGAFSLAETKRIFETALEHGLKIKVHAEQLKHSGASKLVAEMGGLSADHLEQSTLDDWQALAKSGTVGTALPGATVILKKPFPKLRAMWDAGVKVAVATDHNPGSSPLYSMFLAMQLAIALGGLSAEEALIAGSKHSAEALAKSDLGTLKPGAKADFIVIEGTDAMLPLYGWGYQPIHAVYIGGNKISAST